MKNIKHRDTYLFAGIRTQCVLTKGTGEVRINNLAWNRKEIRACWVIEFEGQKNAASREPIYINDSTHQQTMLNQFGSTLLKAKVTVKNILQTCLGTRIWVDPYSALNVLINDDEAKIPWMIAYVELLLTFFAFKYEYWYKKWTYSKIKQWLETQGCTTVKNCDRNSSTYCISIKFKFNTQVKDTIRCTSHKGFGSFKLLGQASWAPDLLTIQPTVPRSSVWIDAAD